MAQIKTTEIRLEEIPTPGAQSPATGRTGAKNSQINANVLKSVLLFGSTGLLVFFGILAILPSKFLTHIVKREFIW